MRSKIKYYYPKTLLLDAVAKSLKINKENEKDIYIKEFACPCKVHHNLTVQFICRKDKESLMFDNCIFSSKGLTSAFSKRDGTISMKGYNYFSRHPDWKIRNAVAIGIEKVKKSSESLSLLSFLANDSHFAVALAACQVLEKINSPDSLKVLQKISIEHQQFRLRRIAMRAIERMIGGVNQNHPLKYLLQTLLNKGRARKVCHQRSNRTKLLIEKDAFKLLANKMQPSLSLLSNAAAFINRFLLEFNKKKLKFDIPRHSKKLTRKRKINFVSSLFFRDAVTVRDIHQVMHPQVGEVYWATTESTDPKVTRPVLIIADLKDYGGKGLRVIPFTSDTSSYSDSISSLIVSVSGKKSKIQLSRQRIIDEESLFARYGVLDEKDLERVIKLLNDLKATLLHAPKMYFPIYSHFKRHQYGNSSVSTRVIKDSDDEFLVSRSSSRLIEPKVSYIALSKQEFKLWQSSATDKLSHNLRNNKGKNLTLGRFFNSQSKMIAQDKKLSHSLVC